MQRYPVRSNVHNKSSKDSSRMPTTSSLYPSKQLAQKPKQTNLKTSKEITVRTSSANGAASSKRKVAQTEATKETWGDMLKTGKSVSNLNKSDPLKTLNILVKELQDKLRNIGDSNIQQIISDMKKTITDVSSGVVSPRKLRTMSETRKSKNSATKLSNFTNTACQTEFVFDIITVEAEKFKKEWEESSRKFEINCKQLENLCSRYKREKEEMELLLKAEKDTVRYLRKKVEETKLGKNKEVEKKLQEMKAQNSVLQVRLQEMKMENVTLHEETKRLKIHIEKENSSSKKELKRLISELQSQKAMCDQEIILLKHHLAKVNMEKEKFQTICNLRTKQVEDIQSEMMELQKIVDENIIDLHKNAIRSAPESVVSNIDNIRWSELITNAMKTNVDGKRKKLMEDDRVVSKETGAAADNTLLSTINSDESSQALLFKDTPSEEKLSFKELPSGDSSNHFLRISSSECSTPRKRHLERLPKALSKERLENLIPSYSNNSDAQTNLREMFAELKRQALQVFPTPNVPYRTTSDTGQSSVAFSDK